MDVGRRFVEEDLAGSRFERCDLTGAVVRGSAVGGLEVDDPWLGRSGEVLDASALHVWAPHVPRRVLQSLHTILAEEWEHLRYALRDLEVVEARGGTGEGRIFSS